MGNKGSNDKDKREQQEIAQLSPREKRKIEKRRINKYAPLCTVEFLLQHSCRMRMVEPMLKRSQDT